MALFVAECTAPFPGPQVPRAPQRPCGAPGLEATGLRVPWPKGLHDVPCRYERDGTTDAPDYQEALVRFSRNYVLNLEVRPPESPDLMAQMGEDPMGHRSEYARFGLYLSRPLAWFTYPFPKLETNVMGSTLRVWAIIRQVGYRIRPDADP